MTTKPTTEIKEIKPYETYRAEILCKNCSKVVWFFIPKGITIEKYLIDNPNCPHCGCDLK